MMFRVFFLSVAFACVIATAMAQQKLDRESALPLGPVMTVSSTFSEHYGDETKKKPAVMKGDTVRYDRAGREMERLAANEAGELAAKQVHRYNDAGQLISTEHL